jgi:hypothetical protein
VRLASLRKEYEKNGWELHDGYVSDYGVCDNYPQILDKYPHLEKGEGKYIILLCRVVKSEQPWMDGWRWRKWGEYIGTKSPQCEYIAHEKDIDEIFCYKLFEIA